MSDYQRVQRDDRLMTAFYAAVTTVEDGRVAEIQIESRMADDAIETSLTIWVRREQPTVSFVAGGGDVGSD